MQRVLRLRRPADFAHMREAGQTTRHPLMTLSTMPNGLDHNRYGFIVSRRVGNAVTRNRVRRRIRESVRVQHAALNRGYDLVWVARNGCAAATYKELSDAVDSLLRRARLYRAAGTALPGPA
jgi:ribonuclease P protein component